MARNSIGQFIAALRKANGMTQQNVADRLNVSNKAVSRWERDECAPDLSVIPALAEMFGVTCDELLRGERIPGEDTQEKKVQKTEKQVRSLINRTLSGFQTLIWISLAVAVIGLICMFGISYGAYRPIIGFAVMLLFEVCAFAIAALAVSRTRNVKTENELFEMADEAQVSKFNKVLGSFSFTAFFVIFAGIILSLPLILTVSQYVDSVLTLHSYFTVFFGGIVLFLALIWLKCRAPYIAWITEGEFSAKAGRPVNKSKRTMTAVQIGLTVLAGVIFVCAPYLESRASDGFSLFNASMIVGLVCLVASIVCYVVFLVKQRNDRKELVLPGIRNIFWIPSALMLSEVHRVSWTSYGPETYSVSDVVRCDSWYTEYLVYAILLAVLVEVVFSLIEAWIGRRPK